LSSLIFLIIAILWLNVGRDVQEIVDLLELQRILVVPLALVIVRRLELLNVGHVDDMSTDGREDDHGGRLELALEPDGDLGLGQEDSAATTGETLVDEDLDGELV